MTPTSSTADNTGTSPSGTAKTHCGRVHRQSALIYNLTSIWRTLLLPSPLQRLRRRLCLHNWQQRPDADYIRRRVDYYCPMTSSFSLGEHGRAVRDIRLRDTHSTYWFDMMRYLRGIPSNAPIAFINGDTWENPPYPVITKARRLDEHAGHCALMKLDRRRHYMHVDDRVDFDDKLPQLFFRGEIHGKPHRVKFFEMWANHPGFDLGDTSTNYPSQWQRPPVTVSDHFRYRYILALEGNDVATALQWICESGCIPVMIRPTVESWFMHGAMIPGVHYIEINPDFSDVAEKIEYYNAHPGEARKIAEASEEWAAQFHDSRRENIISYLVAERYLTLSEC